MTHISRSALLPYEPKALFDLVNDVAAYPQYMAGCVGAEVLSRVEPAGDVPGAMVARLDLAKGKLRYSFTTRNTLLEPDAVRMELVEGPFEEFAGEWRFLLLGPKACKVTLDMRFTLSSKVAAVAAKGLFQTMSDTLVDALCKTREGCIWIRSRSKWCTRCRTCSG